MRCISVIYCSSKTEITEANGLAQRLLIRMQLVQLFPCLLLHGRLPLNKAAWIMAVNIKHNGIQIQPSGKDENFTEFDLFVCMYLKATLEQNTC